MHSPELGLVSCEYFLDPLLAPLLVKISRLVNAFGYWQGQKISNATATYFDDVMQAFTRIQSISGSDTKPELWTGETGWPTDGKINSSLHA